ncbi:PA2169 family four-helix-bundle protein [Dyella jejuensis]|uniref:PA2169 family four-helix-bundle protein n=1 Tax=Dyella jejuensis TaxID=1432009 RepID=A0ABW8JGY9_9GAMM
MSLDIQHLCNGLIRRSIELRALYRHAADQVSEPGLRTVLDEEAQSLALVIAELQAQMRSHDGTPATRSRMIGAARQRFDALLTRNMPRSDDAWIRLLARNEQALLRIFERVLSRVAPSEMTTALNRQLPRLQSIHLDMHSLAKAVSH